MFISNSQLTFNSSKTISRTTTTKLFINDENYDPSAAAAGATSSSSLLSTVTSTKTTTMTMAYIDETTNDGFSSMETTEEFSTSTEEVLYDSGISSDSSFSSCSENLYVTTGPLNFNGICAKKSPDLPPEFFEDLDEDEQSANDSLNTSWEFDSLSAESESGRRSPLSDLTSSHQNQQKFAVPESPVSRKNSRSDLKFLRKRSFRATIAQEGPEFKKKFRPQFHRAFSTSELEISTSSSSCTSSNYDSSPEVSTSKYSLKIVDRIGSKDLAFRRIDSNYLAELIDEETFYEKYILIDCRYPFEYNGGHIKGAINLYDPRLLRSMFYPSAAETDHHNIRSKMPIFYCEFSSVRAPNMANALRELDRQLNYYRYPHVDYSEIYVLSEGYKHFYHNTINNNENTTRAYCIPPSYIPMKSKVHLKELQQYTFHQKSGPMGLSIRSKSTMSLVQAQALNRSPCFLCNFARCNCSKASSPPPPPQILRKQFSQLNMKSPSKSSPIRKPLSPLPFDLDSPFLSCSS